MHYKTISVWIFISLLLCVAIMGLYPSSWAIGLGMLLVPVLLIVQAYVVLTAKEDSEHTFSEGKWYEDE